MGDLLLSKKRKESRLSPADGAAVVTVAMKKTLTIKTYVAAMFALVDAGKLNTGQQFQELPRKRETAFQVIPYLQLGEI